MPKIDRIAIYERDGGLCGFCGQHVPLEVMHLDHIQPKGLGGPTEPDNLRVAHRRCNVAAGKAVVAERRRLGLKPTGGSMIRLYVDLYRWLRQLAKQEHRSLNGQIVHILEQIRADEA